uniref:Uncharacterized protein n=1 Tax=Panagrolaimus superbus TaxID=310955 RepID=A0A914YSQ3_9BILA
MILLHHILIKQLQINYGDYRAQYQVTCDNFIPVPPASIPSKTCTVFSIDAAVYDITKNYQIVTSVSATVNVSNGIGFITGIAKGPDDLISGIYMNVDAEALSLYEPMNDRHNQSISLVANAT